MADSEWSKQEKYLESKTNCCQPWRKTLQMEKNITRICSETLINQWQTYSKFYLWLSWHQIRTVYGERTWYSIERIKNWKDRGLDEILLEVWKTMKFDNVLLWSCNAVNKRNSVEKYTKGCILFFTKKGNLGIIKNYRGITLTAMAAKVYNILLLHQIWPELKKILRKNQNGFQRNCSSNSEILTIHWIIKGVQTENLKATLLSIDFSKTFHSIHKVKMEQIQLVYGFLKEIVTAIKMLYKNTKAMVHLFDGDTDCFDIVTGVWQRDSLAPYLFVLYYVL